MAFLFIPKKEPVKEPLTDQDLMTFGQYKGKKLEDVPASYLLWLHEQSFTKQKYPDVAQYIEDNHSVLEKEMEDNE